MSEGNFDAHVRRHVNGFICCYLKLESTSGAAVLDLKLSEQARAQGSACG
jgi:hypothetical protein